MIVKTVFLLAAFVGHGTSTTTTITVMPDMEACHSAEKALYDFAQTPECGFWTCDNTLRIQKPVKTKCEER